MTAHTTSGRVPPQRVYEFLSPTGDVAAWIEREGVGVRLVIDVDDGFYLDMTTDIALEAAQALTWAAHRGDPS